MRNLIWFCLFSVVSQVQGQCRAWLGADAVTGIKLVYTYSDISHLRLSNEEEAYINACRSFLGFIRSEEEFHVHSLEQYKNELFSLELSNNKAALMAVNVGLQHGLLKLMKGDEIGGVYTIYKAYKGFKSLDSLQCNALEYRKLNGIFQIFSDQVESNSEWVSWFLGVEGDQATGFQLLKSYLNEVKSCDGLYLEGLVLFAYCKLKFAGMSEQELTWLMNEAELYQSPLLIFVLMQNAIKSHSDGHIASLMQHIGDEEALRFPLLGYIKGVAKFNDINKEGEGLLLNFLSTYPGQSFKADALFRIARIRHIEGKTDQRDSILSLIELTDHITTNLDKQVRKEYIYLKNRPPKLTEVRFLFDGGAYEEARARLLQVQPGDYPRFYQVEWWYRKGRIEHLLRHPDEALKAYNKVIELTADDQRYLGPYAALFAAQLELQVNNRDRAVFYLETARKLNTGEYKADISRKIEALKLRL